METQERGIDAGDRSDNAGDVIELHVASECFSFEALEARIESCSPSPPVLDKRDGKAFPIALISAATGVIASRLPGDVASVVTFVALAVELLAFYVIGRNFIKHELPEFSTQNASTQCHSNRTTRIIVRC